MIALSFLSTTVFIYFNWKKGLFGRLMSITFSLISYGLFTSFIAAQGFLLYFPHIARTGYAALLIITPLIYLSLHIGLSKTKLNQAHIYHFIPAILYIINFIPFFILSAEEKIQLITKDNFTKFDEGWLFPKYFVIYLSVGQVIFYIYLFTKNILIPSLKSKNISSEKKWLIYTFYTYLILLLIPPGVSYWAEFHGNNPSSPVFLTYIISQMLFFIVLLNQHKLIISPIFKVSSKNKLKSDLGTISEPEIKILKINMEIDVETLQIIKRINTYFEQENPFLNFNFDQKELSKNLNISNYLIRNSLKKGYGISFSEYVNYHRINYLRDKLKTDSNWRNYTMASLANSIGFKSTNTLYLAFKKHYRITPKEFVDRINDN